MAALESLLLGGFVIFVLLLGAALHEGGSLVVAAVLALVALPFVNARPVVWIALSLGLPWTSRLLTATGLAPQFLDFMDFPLVLIAFVISGAAYLRSDRRLNRIHRGICLRVAVVAMVIALSWAFNTADEPQRLIVAILLALEPFLLLIAFLMAPMTKRDHRMLIGLVTALLCGQLAFSLTQILSGAVADEVKGTLLAAGAGHHVSAGGLTIGFFLLVGLRVRRFVTIPYGILTLIVVVMSDAKQVLFCLPLALLVLGITASRRAIRGGAVRGVAIGVIMAIASVYALTSYQSSATAFAFIERSTTNRTGKVAVAAQLWEDITASAPTAAFGLGPGESVSRFAFLTTPALFKEGSPMSLLGVSASSGADKYDRIAFGGRYTGNSSFTSAQSSLLGVIGDYGVAGALAFSALIWSIVSAVRRVRSSRLRATALASWALLIPLAAVFDWLEQPPFTLAVIVITGLALRETGLQERDSNECVTVLERDAPGLLPAGAGPAVGMAGRDANGAERGRS